jgi:CzcA family heavy metal efflux pump
MRTLIELCLRQRLVVVGLAVILIVLGAVVTSRASFDAFPEFAPPRVEIQTEAPGLSSEQVEVLVTTPLESVLGGTPGMSELRSRSVMGLSSVVLVFETGTNLLEARALVSERVSRARLSPVARPPVVLSPLSSTSRVLKIGIWSSELSQTELTDLIRWSARPRLMSVPGVANVAIWGERNREIQVLVDPERMWVQRVSVDRLVNLTRALLVPLPGGFIDGPNQRLPVSLDTTVFDARSLADSSVVIGESAVPISQLAEVVEGYPAPIGDGVVTNGVGLLLIVEKQPGANTLDVTRGIEAALAELAPSMPGVEIDSTIFRPASFIERALDNLSHALALGTIFVVLVLMLFLWNWRTAAISVVAIPISLLAAASILTLQGMTLDTMVIAGLIIALGEVVDDAIIDVENIHRRLGQGDQSRSLADTVRVVLEASLEVRSAVVYATLIVVLVFLPVFFLPGVAGTFFRPLALGYGLAVLASMVVALTLTPVLALLLLPRGQQQEQAAPLARFLVRGYRVLLVSTVARPKRVIAGCLVLMVGSVAAAGTFRQEFLPHFAENDFLMHWIGRPGTSISAMTRSTDLVRAELLEVPGVRNFGAHIGRAEVADEVVGPNFAELWISVDPSADLDGTMQRVRDVVDGYPGVYRDVQTYLQERMREVLSGGSGAIVVRIFGSDLQPLRDHGAGLAAAISTIEGVEHASPEAQVDIPQVEIVVSPEACALHRIDAGEVRRQVAMLLQGTTVGTIVRGQQPIDVVVWMVPQARADADALRDILITASDTRMVRLGDVASVTVGPVPNTIAHQRGSRKLDVTIALDAGADLARVSAAIEDVVADYVLPAGYHTEMLGEQVARADSQRTLIGLGALSLIGVFLVLLADFRSIRLAALVMCSIPLALVGGILMTASAGGVVSLGTLVGLVTVLGIASRNGILLISHYRHIEEDEGMPFGVELVVRGATERLAPILMTALSTGLALVPLVAAGQTAGHEIEYPMAVVILGGLISSTLLNLFAMPVVVLLSRAQSPPSIGEATAELKQAADGVTQ